MRLGWGEPPNKQKDNMPLPSRPKLPKWWLPPEKMAELLAYCRTRPEPFLRARLMADYIEWVCFTGMRVEETLRLKFDDVRLDIREEGNRLVSYSEFTVPGTGDAPVTLALALIPALLIKRRLEARTGSNPHVFPINYDRLSRDWVHPRSFLREFDNKAATLKALRRSAARHLTVSGMPTPILMEYLRHSNIQTTMGWLRLTGGYSTNEQRRWL